MIDLVINQKKVANYFINYLSIFYLLLIFIVSIMIKTTISFYFSSPIILGDEVEYFTKASAIINSQNIFAPPPILNTFPGYPLVISICFFLFHTPISVYHSILILNIILSSLIIFPTYFILKKYCDERTSIIGSMILVTLPCLTVYEFLMMSENLFIPLFIFSFWFFIEYCENKSSVFGILFLLTLIMLAMTRPIGFLMGMSIFFIFSFEKFIKLSKSLKMVTSLIVIILCLVLYFLITDIIIDNDLIINQYNISYFFDTTLQSVATTDSLLHLFSLFLYKIEYLILSGYYVFFLLTCLLLAFLFLPKMSAKILKSDIIRNINSLQQSSLKKSGAYVFLSSLLIVITSVFFNYRSETVFIGNQYQFEVYGRYIDPIVPMLFILGIISLSLLSEQIKRPVTTVWIFFIVLNLMIIFIFNLTFPFVLKEQYAIGNNFAIWYLIDLKNLIPIWCIVTILFIVMNALQFFELYSKKLKHFFLLIVVLVSVFIGSLAIMNELSLSSYQNTQNQIGRYLTENSNESILLIIDSKSQGPTSYIWLALFLAKGPVKYYPINNESSLPSDNTNHFLLSSKLFNLSRVYFPIGTTTGGLYLYNPCDIQLNPLEPYKSLITSNDDEYLWFEPEKFQTITSHTSGWGKASQGYQPLSNDLVLSGSNIISTNNVINQTFNSSTKNDIYYYWVRSRLFSFSPSSYILEIDNLQFPYYQNRTNSNKWIWIYLGNSTLDEGQHTLSLIKTIPSQERPIPTWAGIDMILITNNMTYVPIDGTIPPMNSVLC